MPCDFPLKGYRTPPGSDQPITFNPLKALNSTNPIDLPCGRCTGCRIDKSRDWAIRCMHEAQMHPSNSFITLTYADEHVPDDYSVYVRTLQLFMKRLRKSLKTSTVRFFGCGEYGDRFYRPHYHAIIFNHDFPDRKFLKFTDTGERLYTSEKLLDVWPYGYNTIGDVTFKSAAYCSRYVLKKQVGDKADEHYWRLNPFTMQMVRQQPEFATQSRMPGLGLSWFYKYKADVFPSDFVVVDGNKLPVPRYYLTKLAEEEQELIKKARSKNRPTKAERAKPRLQARAEVRDSRLSQLKRNLKDH